MDLDVLGRLSEACLRGNSLSFMGLYNSDHTILDLVFPARFSETPLHTASTYGHVEYAELLLKLKPGLATKLDSQGYSPLHLASVRTNIDMVTVLVKADADVCTVPDQEGRTPLHLAAMNGRLEIMRVLINARPSAIQIAPRGETILHLCVKHNRLEALKLLVGFIALLPNNEHYVSIKAKDHHGNNVLHLAVARRQMKTIEYLLQRNVGVELNAKNKNGLTALDVLSQTTRNLTDMEIEIANILGDAGVSRARDVNSRVITTTAINNCYHKDDDWLRKNQKTVMVVASLMAAMAFQAGLNPPGGVWQDDSTLSSRDNVHTFLHYLQNLPKSVLTTDHDKNDAESMRGIDFVKALMHTTGYNNQELGAVWEDIWENIKFNHTGFFPYLIRYAGTSILAYKSQQTYVAYIICNAVGYLASLSIILLLISGLPIDRKSYVRILMVIMCVTITATAFSYTIAMSNLIPPFLVYNIFSTSIKVWLGLMGLVCLPHIHSFISWLMKKRKHQ